MRTLGILPPLLVCACAAGPAQIAKPPVARTTMCMREPAKPSTDALGAKPEVLASKAFVPPAPETRTASDVPVHTLVRTSLPLVAVSVVVRGGAALDPKGKPGLYHFLSRMFLEGAGTRTGVQLAQAFDALGADYGVSAYSDYLVFSFVVLKDKVDAATELLAEVMAKPTFAQSDFVRAKGLWMDELKNQERDPKALAERLAVRELFGPSHPYGHLRTGDSTLSSNVALADVKRAYDGLYASRAMDLVVVGDVIPDQPARIASRLFRDIKKTTTPIPVWPSQADYRPPFGKIVLVDKPDAPQAVVSLVTHGVAAADQAWAALPRVNSVLGGSFTSRLNQDIREERGLAYGASSRLSFARNRGMFVASASLFSAKAAEGTQALVEDVYQYAQSGPTEEETAKSQLLARSDLVETFESATQSAARLARNLGAGLPAGVDRELGPVRDAATQKELAALAASLLPKGQAFVVFVGPKAEAEKALPSLAPWGITSIVSPGKP
jgi:zinc protease